MKLKEKIGLGVSLLGGVALFLGASGSYTASLLSSSYNGILEEDVPTATAALEAHIGVLMLRRFEKDMFLNLGNKEALDEYFKKFKAQVTKTNEQAATLKKLVGASEHLDQSLKGSIDKMPTYLATYEECHAKVMARLETEKIVDPAAANKIFTDCKGDVHNLEKSLAPIPEAAQKTLSAEKEKSASLALKGSRLLYALIVAALGGAVFVWAWAMRNVVKPIVKVSDLANAVSNGDLEKSLEVRSDDEIGDMTRALNGMSRTFRDRATAAQKVADGDLSQRMVVLSDADTFGRALNTMVDNLKTLVVKAQNTSDKVSSMARQVSTASESVSQSATEQAASLEEMSSSMSDLSSQVKTNATNAESASAASALANASAARGKNQIETTLKDMKELNEVSGQISKIIKVIDDIAFQTNLLALNAAVEAARAGKHGKGFAVVADEVRNLASRSAKAANETTELIEASQRKVENGLGQVLKSSEIFDEIVHSVSGSNELVRAISQASSAQATAIAQIEQGIAQINQANMQTTANAEEAASASQELTSEASELRDILRGFRV
jgi:methyl-accepting chemotaxis protein